MSVRWSNGVTGSSICSDLADPCEAAGVESRRRFLSWRLLGYSIGCLFVTLGFSVMSIGLWSDMGCQAECLRLLQQNSHYSWHLALVVVAVLLVLYVLDFFMPTHLSGRCFALADSNAILGRGLFAVAVLASVSWLYLRARAYPTLPLVLTALFGPVSVVLLRRVTMPVVPNHPQSFASVKGLQDRIALIKLLTWEDKDEKNFYMAATGAFAVSGLACLVAWTPWAVAYEDKFSVEMANTQGRAERELLFARWAAPVFIAVSNLVYAAFALLRVTQSGAYGATDHIKNQLVFDFRSSCQKHMQYRIAWLRARVIAARDQHELAHTTQDRLQRYLVQHISATRKLSKIVKSVCLTIVALILALHIVFQMTTAVNHNAVMVQGFLASYLSIFVVFIFVSFSRVSRKMTVELMDLPIVRNAMACSEMDWARALFLCFCLPAMPVVLAVSVANQIVRRHRGVTQTNSLLTERVEGAIRHMKTWSWPDVLGWCYIMAGVLMVFRVSPILLNVLLAWMSWVMADFNFWLMVAVTFAMGTFLFMLPPVPGPIIYPFAGIVMSNPKKCPFGFVGGCVISVLVSFFMKMLACTLQQKGIGEVLGGRMSIRRAVGIHTPPIRAIENVLKQPGLPFGKCMILCGGPDWPTSVLAGILRLSLWQCLLGTCPVILSIVPMALTGSFYLKRNESEVWMRTGNLMLLLTTCVSAFFLVGIGWAIQDEYDKRGDEIRKPKEAYVELEWLDYRSAAAAKKCKVTWADIPRFIKAVYVSGAVLATCTGHLLLWFTTRCFGSFQLTDDIQTLRWFGSPGALIKVAGLAGLSVAAASYLGLVAFNCWRSRWTRGPLQEAFAELDAKEAEWKEAWLLETRRVNAMLKLRRSSSSVPTLLSARSNVSLRSMAGDLGKTPRSLSAPAHKVDFGFDGGAGGQQVAGQNAVGMRIAPSARGRVLEYALSALRQTHRPERSDAPGGAVAALGSDAGTLVVHVDSGSSWASSATGAGAPECTIMAL